MAMTSTEPVRELRDLLMGAGVTRACQIAGELGLADALVGGPRSVHALSAHLNLHAASLLRLMRLLAAHGIFVESSGTSFANTPMSEYLRTDHPESLRGLACALSDNAIWRAWEGLEKTVRGGGAAFEHVHGAHLFEYLADHPDCERRFGAAMASSSAVLNRALASAYPWGNHACIADIGGGTGTTLMHLLRHAGTPRGLLFDLPSVVSQARKVWDDSGLADRCDLMGGSFFDYVPAGAEVYLLKMVLHDWGDAECRRILRKCRAALSPGARVLVCERLLTGKASDRYANVTDTVMLVLTRHGRERTGEEYADLMAGADLSLRAAWPVDGEMHLLEAVAIGDPLADSPPRTAS